MMYRGDGPNDPPGDQPNPAQDPWQHPSHDPDCELCEAARFTHWYASDTICWVADCEACNVPMAVWNQHGIEPPTGDREHMLRVLTEAADGRFEVGGWALDDDMRTIPDHFHMHARDPDWFSERFRRPISRYTGVGEDRVER